MKIEIKIPDSHGDVILPNAISWVNPVAVNYNFENPIVGWAHVSKEGESIVADVRLHDTGKTFNKITGKMYCNPAFKVDPKDVKDGVIQKALLYECSLCTTTAALVVKDVTVIDVDKLKQE